MIYSKTNFNYSWWLSEISFSPPRKVCATHYTLPTNIQQQRLFSDDLRKGLESQFTITVCIQSIS